MGFPQLGWEQDLDRLAGKFCNRISKDFRSLWIGFNDATVSIDNDQAFARRLEIFFVGHVPGNSLELLALPPSPNVPSRLYSIGADVNQKELLLVNAPDQRRHALRLITTECFKASLSANQ
jgi:hypothetical protein